MKRTDRPELCSQEARLKQAQNTLALFSHTNQQDLGLTLDQGDLVGGNERNSYGSTGHGPGHRFPPLFADEDRIPPDDAAALASMPSIATYWLLSTSSQVAR
jgi:hypothetical protein